MLVVLGLHRFVLLLVVAVAQGQLHWVLRNRVLAVVVVLARRTDLLVRDRSVLLRAAVIRVGPVHELLAGALQRVAGAG